MKYYLLLLIFLTAACGSGGGSSSGGSSDKNLFGVWTHTTTGWVMDLTGGSLNSNLVFRFLFNTGAQCSCTFNAIGTQSSGNYVLSNCTYVNGTGTGNPGCNSLNNSGSYTKNSATLTVCDSNGCGTYQ